MIASLSLVAFREAHGHPAYWSSAQFDLYLELSVAVAAVVDPVDVDKVRTEHLLDNAADAFSLDIDCTYGLALDGPAPRQLDLDFESVVTWGLFTSPEAYPPAGHTYAKER